jgi:hypothetical protein
MAEEEPSSDDSFNEIEPAPPCDDDKAWDGPPGEAAQLSQLEALAPAPKPLLPLGLPSFVLLVPTLATAIALDPLFAHAPGVLWRASLAVGWRLLWLSLRFGGWALLAALAFGAAWLAYKLTRLAVFVFTYADPGAGIEHGCIPDDDDSWDHR